MTREELRGIVEGISDEQLKRILDINSSDIGKVKKNAEGLQKELDEVNKALGELTAEKESLLEGQYEAEKMKNKIEELQKVIDDRKAEDERNLKNQEIQKRFDAVTGDAEFLNDFTRKGVLERFSEAISVSDNVGKSDAEIFEAITSDVGNIFSSRNDMPSVLASTSGFGADLTMGEVREIMGLAPER